MPIDVATLARNLNRAFRETASAVSPALDLSSLFGPEVVPRRRVVRADDLFAAEFAFHNLRFEAPGGKRLVRRVPSRPAYLVMELQGQHFGEEVLILAEATPVASDQHHGLPRNEPPAAPGVLRARLAHPSRIAVEMPATLAALDYTLEALLDAITIWPPSLDGLARTAPSRWVADRPGFAVLDRAGLSVAASVLRELSAGLEAALTERKAAALAPALARRAHRTAMLAVDAIDRQALPTVAHEAVEVLRRELARDRSLDAGTREIALALFEVRLAEKAAGHALSHAVTAPAIVELAEAARAILLLLTPHPPSERVTALELPYRLIQSPHAGSTFSHPDAPITLSGRTELWRTTLARRTPSGPQPLGPSGAPVTAMWSPDYVGNAPLATRDPFRMSVFPRHRNDIVRLMSGHLERLPGGRRYTPSPAVAHRLQLSTWGGVLELDGAWIEQPLGVNVEAWNHDASYGRDERVRVVEAGFLYPFGHRASLVTLTERLVDAQKPTGVAAFLRQRQFIVVREFEKDFPAPGQQYGGRKLPFTRITCLTRRTPDLQQDSFDPAATVAGQVQAFWPIAIPGATPTRFEFEALDLAGRRVVFSSPAVFIFKSFIDNHAALMHHVDAAWSGTAASPNPRAEIPLGGQTVRMAPVAGGSAGDVDVPVDNIVFEATPAAGRRPPFHPAIRVADARIKALEAVTGQRGTHRVEFEAATYLPRGYQDNAWRVFLALKSPHKVSMGPEVPTDRVGGIGQPTQTLSAISNGSGAVSGSVNALTQGSVQPADMFPDAKILGNFDLKDLIAPFVVAAAGTIPGFRTEEHADRIETIWEFEDDEVNSPIPGLKTGAGGKKSALKLSAKLTAHFTYPDPDLGFKDKNGDPAPDFGAGTDPGWKDPEAEATGKLTNFKLDFFGFVIVWFDEFSFKSSLKNKFDPKPKLNDDHPVVFGGPLEFVNKLSEILPSGGFTDPPIIKPSLTDLTVGYDFELPAVEVGIFALKNMKVGALLKIPFTGDPVALRFFFSQRESPFLLTVSMFGGGGFFAIVTTAQGVQEIEAAFEFGAFAQFSVGVASGGVYVKAGVYFHWKTDAVELEGYVEMGGELSVLGIISVSITLHLSLGYYKESGSALVRGQATLVIEVSLLFFSVSVKAKVERKFAGSSGDPTFAQLVSDEAIWARYCSAFA
jgi:hypothetical protein